MGSWCPTNVARTRPFSGSRKRMEPSSSPVAKVRPSADIATALTLSFWRSESTTSSRRASLMRKYHGKPGSPGSWPLSDRSRSAWIAARIS